MVVSKCHWQRQPRKILLIFCCGQQLSFLFHYKLFNDAQEKRTRKVIQTWKSNGIDFALRQSNEWHCLKLHYMPNNTSIIVEIVVSCVKTDLKLYFLEETYFFSVNYCKHFTLHFTILLYDIHAYLQALFCEMHSST